MPAISCGFPDEAHGKRLLIKFGACVGVTLGLDRTWDKQQQRPPKTDGNKIEALIDTGAEESCIDSALATRLRLPIIDRRTVCGVGSMEVDVFLGQIHVERLRYTISGQFAGVPLKEHGHRQQVLLGRTFLQNFKLLYDGRSAEVTIEYVGDKGR